MKLTNKYYCDVFDVTSEGNLITIYKNILSIDNKILEGKFNNFSQIDNKIFTYNLAENKTVFYDIKTLRNIYSSNHYLGVRNDIDKRKVRKNYLGQTETIDNEFWAFINSINFEVIRTIETNIHNRNLLLVSDNHFISKDKDSIALKNIINNETLWQHSFSDLLEGEKIETVGDIKIFDDSLFIPLIDNKNNKNKATVEIDIETGILKNQFKDFYGKLILDTYYLYVAHYYEVKKMNLETTKIIEFNFEDILKPKDLKIHWDKSIVKDNKLYFVDFKIYSTNRMGIIDIEKGELIWQKDFEINDGINNNIQEIRVEQNRLYVHCSDNTLHIFEEE